MRVVKGAKGLGRVGGVPAGQRYQPENEVGIQAHSFSSEGKELAGL